MAVRRRVAAAAAAMVTLLAPAALSGCGAGAAGEVNYAVDGVLNTYNTNTSPAQPRPGRRRSRAH